MPTRRKSWRRSTTRRSCRSRSRAAERLVEQQQPGLGGEGTGERDPLLLAARQRGDRAGARSRAARRGRAARRPVRPRCRAGAGPACAGRSRRCRATSRCGNELVVLEHQPEAAPVRRHAGQVARRPSTRGPASGSCRPATTRSSVLLPLPLGPSSAHDLARRPPSRSTPSSTVPPVEANGDVLEPPASELRSACRSRKRSTTRIATARDDHQDDGEGMAWPVVDGAGPAEQPVDGDRQRRGAVPGEEDGGAELAERHGEGEAGRRRAAARPHHRQRRPRATPAPGERRGRRRPRAGAGRWRAARAARRAPRTAWPPAPGRCGMRIHERPQVERRLVEGDEETRSRR